MFRFYRIIIDDIKYMDSQFDFVCNLYEIFKIFMSLTIGTTCFNHPNINLHVAKKKLHLRDSKLLSWTVISLDNKNNRMHLQYTCIYVKYLYYIHNAYMNLVYIIIRGCSLQVPRGCENIYLPRCNRYNNISHFFRLM